MADELPPLVVPVGRKGPGGAAQWQNAIPVAGGKPATTAEWQAATPISPGAGAQPAWKTAVPVSPGGPETAGSSRGVPAQAPAEGPPQPSQEPSVLGLPFTAARRNAQQGLDTMKEGFGQLTGGEGLKEKAVGGVKTLLGGVGYVMSPVSGAVDAIVGAPVEKATGSKKAGELASFAAQVALPGPKLMKGTADSKVVKGAEKILAPELVDKQAVPIRAGRNTNFLKPSEEAASHIRAAGGEAARDTEISREALDAHRRLVNTMNDADRLDFIQYVEGRSTGAALRNPQAQQLADTLKQAMDLRKQKLAQLPSTAKMGFVEDYFPHIWADPQQAMQIIRGVSREGRGGFTKERSIPTIADGLAVGLQPRTLDPIETAMQYIENADRYIALNHVFDESRSLGLIRYALPGKAPDGWVKLQGRLGYHRGNMEPYAPEGYARVYNNFVSKGVTGDFKAPYEALQHASNTLTALELSFSGYHAFTMANEAMINSLANSLGAAKNLRFGEAGKRAVGSLFAPATRWRTGKKLEQVYLGSTPGSQQMRQIADLLTEAGGRVRSFRQSLDYQYSGAGSYFKAFKQGALKTQLLADAQKVQGEFGKGVGAGSLQLAKTVGKQIGRTMDSFAQPLFEVYIPRLKNGAFYDNMARWLAEHPGASHAEQVAGARKVWDSIDNRFGEMVQDNIFWNRALKQGSMLAMRSYSWNLGTVREIGGGARDILSREWTQKTEYVLAMALQYGLMSAAYQYLKTGEPPKDMQDLIAPRTGGVTIAGREPVPERITPPGYMKDVFGWYGDPWQEAKNKLSTGVRLPFEMIENKDWRGAPIAPPADPDANWMQNVPPWMVAMFGHVVEAATPISAGPLVKGQPEGSGLGRFEGMMGVRPAGMKYTAPTALEEMLQKKQMREWKMKQDYDKRQEEKYGGPQ